MLLSTRQQAWCYAALSINSMRSFHQSTQSLLETSRSNIYLLTVVAGKYDFTKEILKRNKCDLNIGINKNTQEPLPFIYLSVIGANVEITRLFLRSDKYGADLNTKNKDGSWT